jgi:hypothetical protein
LVNSIPDTADSTEEVIQRMIEAATKIMLDGLNNALVKARELKRVIDSTDLSNLIDEFQHTAMDAHPRILKIRETYQTKFDNTGEM